MDYMKLHLILITLISFSCFSQQEVAFEFAYYQNKESDQYNIPIVKVEQYWKIYSNGKIEVINIEGICTIFQLDSTIFNNLNTITQNGLETFRNKTKLQENQFYAGNYSFLKKGAQTVCFNPYDVEVSLKKVLTKIENTIKNQKTNAFANCTLPLNLNELIQETHSISNLIPNADPPSFINNKED